MYKKYIFIVIFLYWNVTLKVKCLVIHLYFCQEFFKKVTKSLTKIKGSSQVGSDQQRKTNKRKLFRKLEWKLAEKKFQMQVASRQGADPAWQQLPIPATNPGGKSWMLPVDKSFFSSNLISHRSRFTLLGMMICWHLQFTTSSVKSGVNQDLQGRCGNVPVFPSPPHVLE